MIKEHFVLRLSEREVVALKRGLARFAPFDLVGFTSKEDLPVLQTIFARLELLPVIEPLKAMKK